jgi:hypothetical protein
MKLVGGIDIAKAVHKILNEAFKMKSLFMSATIVTGLILCGVSIFANNTEVNAKDTSQLSTQITDTNSQSLTLNDQSGISGKSSIQRNEEGINESYLGCLMFDNDPNSIQKCSDLRWGSEQALYNNSKTSSNITVKDLKKATPPSAALKIENPGK